MVHAPRRRPDQFPVSVASSNASGDPRSAHRYVTPLSATSRWNASLAYRAVSTGLALRAEEIRVQSSAGVFQARIFRKASGSWSSAQPLQTHQAFDRVQAAIDAFGQHVVPYPTCAVDPIRPQEACPDKFANHFIPLGPIVPQPRQPSVDPASRHTERVAHPTDPIAR